MYHFLTCRTENYVAVITLNRPEVMNALSVSVLKELEAVMEELNRDPGVKAVIITGTKKAFIAGADIAEMKEMTAEEAQGFSRLGHRVFRLIERSGLIVIAAVNGYALGGGCELAMACDIRVGADTAIFGFPESTLGVIPGFSGTQRLPRLVGMGAAKELLATGRKLSAKRAWEIGLVNHVVLNTELMNFSMDMAQSIAKNSRGAVAAGKQLINLGSEMDFDKAEEYEAALFGITFSTADQKEGMAAFLEKRSPRFL